MTSESPTHSASKDSSSDCDQSRCRQFNAQHLKKHKTMNSYMLDQYIKKTDRNFIDHLKQSSDVYQMAKRENQETEEFIKSEFWN